MFSILKLSIVICIFALTEASVTFDNLVCESYDKSFGYFDLCQIKAVNRSLKLISGRLVAKKLPITEGEFRFALFKRANGWKPFLYNYTQDLCKFMAAKNRHAVMNHFVNTVADYANFVHPCPINHDFIVTDWPTSTVNNFWSKLLPMPTGQYQIRLMFYKRKKTLNEIQLTLTLT